MLTVSDIYSTCDIPVKTFVALQYVMYSIYDYQSVIMSSRLPSCQPVTEEAKLT
jgi:hypothetical protein